MYTIDLLKSNGLPARSNIKNAVAVGFLFSIPMVMFVMMTGSYAQSKMLLNSHGQTLGQYENRFGNLKSYMVTEELIWQRYNILNESLHEVKDILNNNVQWTPSLVTIERLLPPALAIGRMEIKIKTFQKTVPQKKDPDVAINVTRYKRILTIYLHSSSKINSDDLVTKFKNDLTNTPLLKSRVRDITISSRKPEKINGIDMMSYEMNCTFGDDI